MIKQIVEFFGQNALRGKSEGCTIQQIADINKETAMLVFGLSTNQAEQLVTLWINECLTTGVFIK
jgi:uncharacterized protein YpbB